MPRLALPFLDAVGECDEHGIRRQALIRPWQVYWPPEEGGELHSLLAQKCPEVLTWRFNPDDPFDRPWQNWSKQAILVGKVCTSHVLPPKGVQDGLIDNKETKRENLMPTLGVQRCQAQVSGIEEIDRIIESLGLRVVVPAQFNYLSPDTLYESVKPFHTRLPFMGAIKRSNIVAQGYSDIRVFDIHGYENQFTLATSGFQVVRVPHHCDQWTDGTVRRTYLPAMTAWLQRFFNCRKVIIYAYTVRAAIFHLDKSSAPHISQFRCANRERTATESWVGPYMRAHCDVTSNSGLRRLDLHVPHDADEIKKGRYRFIGLWRPLTTPYQDQPLAMLDHRTLCQTDLIGADIVFPHYCDEGYEVLHSPNHRWFYKQQMDTDEVIMFKLYDNSPDEVKFCPHSAFVDPSVPPDTPPRASVEIRALLVG